MAAFDARIAAIVTVARRWADETHPLRLEAVARTLTRENRFTEEAVRFAVNQQMSLLRAGDLRRWIGDRRAGAAVRVGVIGAGNVPFADLQDFLAVFLSGHDFIGKVSARSPDLLPAFASEVAREAGCSAPDFVETGTLFKESEALIASGSDTTIDAIRHRAEEAGISPDRLLMRGSGFGVAVVDGRETDVERSGLAEDVLLHEGMGCRNVALIWAPAGLSPDPYLDILSQFRTVFPASERTRGALKIPEAFLQAIRFPYAAGDGFLISKGLPEVQPPGHIRWVEYGDLTVVNDFLGAQRASIRVLLAPPRLRSRLAWAPAPFGSAQRPVLDWHAGGRELFDFLGALG